MTTQPVQLHMSLVTSVHVCLWSIDGVQQIVRKEDTRRDDLITIG